MKETLHGWIVWTEDDTNAEHEVVVATPRPEHKGDRQWAVSISKFGGRVVLKLWYNEHQWAMKQGGDGPLWHPFREYSLNDEFTLYELAKLGGK